MHAWKGHWRLSHASHLKAPFPSERAHTTIPSCVHAQNGGRAKAVTEWAPVVADPPGHGQSWLRVASATCDWARGSARGHAEQPLPLAVQTPPRTAAQIWPHMRQSSQSADHCIAGSLHACITSLLQSRVGHRKGKGSALTYKELCYGIVMLDAILTYPPAWQPSRQQTSIMNCNALSCLKPNVSQDAAT